MPKTALLATYLDLISFLRALPDVRMRRGISILAWYVLLVVVLGILSRCQRYPKLAKFSLQIGEIELIYGRSAIKMFTRD